MPITTTFQGIVEPGSFRDDDRRLMASRRGQDTIARIWRNSRVDMHVVYLNRPVARTDVAQRYGPIGAPDLRRDFGARVRRTPGAITVVFSHNEGAERLPLTGWIIAHRAYHIFEEAHRNGRYPHAWPPRHRYPRLAKPYRATYDFIDLAIRKFQEAYCLADANGQPTERRVFPHNQVGNAIGTSRAARERKLPDSGELKHEAFAQYVLQGAVRFKAPPERYEYAGRLFLLDPAMQDDLTAFVAHGESVMAQNFDKLIAYAKGKIFLL
jgi:hypothetical protein